jgi:hypothetical protein
MAYLGLFSNIRTELGTLMSINDDKLLTEWLLLRLWVSFAFVIGCSPLTDVESCEEDEEQLDADLCIIRFGPLLPLPELLLVTDDELLFRGDFLLKLFKNFEANKSNFVLTTDKVDDDDGDGDE